MATMRDWLRDWRAVADMVPDGRYEPITERRGDETYEVLQVSAYDPEVDGERRVVRSAVRAFDDRLALLTARTRDLGLVRVIAVRGTPRFVLEPGADAIEWSAADEGVSPRELAMAVGAGTIGRRVARLVGNRERRSRERLAAQVTVLQEQLDDALAEAEVKRGELVALRRSISRGGRA